MTMRFSYQLMRSFPWEMCQLLWSSVCVKQCIAEMFAINFPVIFHVIRSLDMTYPQVHLIVLSTNSTPLPPSPLATGNAWEVHSTCRLENRGLQKGSQHQVPEEKDEPSSWSSKTITITTKADIVPGERQRPYRWKGFQAGHCLAPPHVLAHGVAPLLVDNRINHEDELEDHHGGGDIVGTNKNICLSLADFPAVFF